MSFSRTHIAHGFVTFADQHGTKKAIEQLAALVLEQHLHGQVEEILADIEQEYLRVHGVAEAHVKTAFKLSDKLKTELGDLVKRTIDAKQVNIIEEVDRSLLGGVTVTAPDMELDLSLRTKLSKLKV